MAGLKGIMKLSLAASEREALRAVQRRTRKVEVCKRIAVLLELDAGLGLDGSTLWRYEAAWGAKGWPRCAHPTTRAMRASWTRIG